LQLLDHHFVFSLQLALGDQVVQVEVEPALADAVAGELAGIGVRVVSSTRLKLVAISRLAIGSNGLTAPLMVTGA
jgi:uncharacterized protein YgfB (UPF0149 family)